MFAQKTGNIGINGMGQRMDWPKSRFCATRDKGSDYIDITLPAGPKTDKTVSLRVKLSELRALADWLEAA